MNFKQGIFKPQNPQKYIGDSSNIVYRSGWEKRVMDWCDTNTNIVRWASEEIVIPYISPIDNRGHRYFPDFYVEAKAPDGKVRKLLIEVKPKAQTEPPKVPRRKTRRYITEVMTYGVNQAKWEQAKLFCEEKGWEFLVITEQELFRKK